MIAPAWRSFAITDGVRGGDVVEQDLRVACGRQAGDVDDVLDADRHAVQRTADAAGGDLGLGGARRVHRGIGVEPDEGVQLRVQPLDPRQQRGQQFDRREAAGGEFPHRLGGGQPVQLAHSPVPARIGGQGSAAGSVGYSIAPWLPSACCAASATSSGNSASALSRPGGVRQLRDQFLVHLGLRAGRADHAIGGAGTEAGEKRAGEKRAVQRCAAPPEGAAPRWRDIGEETGHRQTPAPWVMIWGKSL